MERTIVEKLRNPPVMSMALDHSHLYRMMAERMEQAADEIERLQAQAWQPIETAPRDGTDILVWDGERRTMTLWGKVSHVPIFGFLDVWGCDAEDIDLMDPQPTHWMPLPDPPAETL